MTSLARRFLCGVAQSLSLPVSESLLRQSVPQVTEELKENLTDKTAGTKLAPLMLDQFVNGKPNDQHRDERWNFGEVLNEVASRSYLIKTADELVRRNRTNVRPAEAALSCNQQPLAQQAVPALSYSKTCLLQTALLFSLLHQPKHCLPLLIVQLEPHRHRLKVHCKSLVMVDRSTYLRGYTFNMSTVNARKY